MSSPRRSPSLALAAATGVVAAGVALGTAELVAGVRPGWRSPVLDVGDRVIDAAPTAVKEFAVDTFGTNDKAALLMGIGVLLAAYAAVVGVVALRRRLSIGVVGVAAFGVVGIWASRSRREGAPWTVIAPSVVAAVAGVVVLVVAARRFGPRDAPVEGDRAPEPPAAAMPPGAAPGRRAFLTGAGAFLVGASLTAGALGGLGRWLGRRFSAAESRAAVRLPPPVQSLARRQRPSSTSPGCLRTSPRTTASTGSTPPSPRPRSPRPTTGCA